MRRYGCSVSKTKIIKYPRLLEDAKITIKRDFSSKVRAGGYNYDKAYSDLSAYSKLGLF